MTGGTISVATGVSVFELSRVMGSSLQMIDKSHGHLALGSEDLIRARLEARSNHVATATEEEA